MAKRRYRSRGDSDRNSGRSSSTNRSRRRRPYRGDSYRQDFNRKPRPGGSDDQPQPDDSELSTDAEPGVEQELSEGIGLLEMHPNGYGFLRSPEKQLLARTHRSVRARHDDRKISICDRA